jgi:hypothetical protein
MSAESENIRERRGLSRTEWMPSLQVLGPDIPVLVRHREMALLARIDFQD